jgi:hypothetical protein
MRGGGRRRTRDPNRWRYTGHAIRKALEARGLIAVAALGAACTCALLRDDWSSLAFDYLLWDFGLTNLACFDVGRGGGPPLLWHIALSAGWIAMIAFLTPWIGERLAALS